LVIWGFVDGRRSSPGAQLQIINHQSSIINQIFRPLSSVAELANLYLGNLLYALERCAMSLEADGDREGAAFYRGIARALAEARRTDE
jgi:hypothetical protein